MIMRTALVWLRLAVILAVAASIALTGQLARGADESKTMDYSAAVTRFEALAAAELDRKLVHGFSVAFVDDQRIVFAKGFGQADAARGAAATPQTIYRAGSISKLFNAIAVMQLVERGKMDLDAPIQKALPEFRIVVPFEPSPAITLRQILCHRSGMIRESPVGGYFDGSGPTIAATVASVAQCVLVNPPNTKTRYSNVGPTIAGHAVEKLSGLAFPEYQQQHVLGPLGMTSTCWLMNDKLRPRLATGYMQVARPGGGFDEQPAPRFELGTLPAGNLYTTVEDLSRLLMMIFAQGHAGEQAVIQPSSLEQMLTPQTTGGPRDFGLAFVLGKLRDYKTVGHMGAVYGFTTSVVGIPEKKIGVIVLTNGDLAVGPARKLSNAALDLMLEARGERIGQQAAYSPSSDELAAIAGEFESQSYWAKVSIEAGRATAIISGESLPLTPTGPYAFVADGRIAHREPVTFERDSKGAVVGFATLQQTFRRLDPQSVPTPPAEWQKFLGSYGPAYIPLIVSIRHGHLYAMTENEFDYRLTPLNRTAFRTPPGLYDDEQIVFQQDALGHVHSAVLANMVLPKTGGGR